MAGFLAASIMPNPRARRVPLWMSVGTGLLFLALLLFLNVGRWLVREDPLQKATAIAVLSGRMPERALEAVRIYKRGCAPRVWLTHSTEPGATLAQLSVRYIGEEEYNKEILMRGGVPESAIEILDPPIENTAGEIRTIAEALAKRDHGTAIVVTSRVHTRRVRALWNQLAKRDGTVVVRGVSDDGFDPAHWWRDTQDALDVVREVLGLMNAWAGLPLGHSGKN
jgi:uncharacterized SAM-binding protein YcdF (DUF218 family)